MPPRNERQFSYLSYENLCLKNLRIRLVYILIISIRRLRNHLWLYYGYGYGRIIIM